MMGLVRAQQALRTATPSGNAHLRVLNPLIGSRLQGASGRVLMALTPQGLSVMCEQERELFWLQRHHRPRRAGGSRASWPADDVSAAAAVPEHSFPLAAASRGTGE